MKLYCRTYSSGKFEELYQSPIIFLHGMAFSGDVFKKVAPMISKKTKKKVYVPDVRNHGKSPWVKDMNYDVLTHDVLELMQQNSISKAILVGSSMGGRTAMNFALKYPHKVEALVIEDMTPRNITSSGNNLVKTLHEYVKDVLNSFPPDTDLNEAKMDLVELILNIVPFRINREKVLAQYDPDYVPIVKEGSSFRLECNADVVVKMLENDTLVQNLPDLGATFNGDTLFLYGTKGFFNLDKDPTIKKLFPRAVIVKVEDASHLIHIDSPKEYIDIITNFILYRSLFQSKY